MNDERKRRLTEAIADGDAFELPADGSAMDSGIEALSQIAAAFRNALGNPPASREFLFRWRHLEAVERIGEGGFGEVYRAYDPILKRDVALKLGHQSSADLRARDRLIVAEARRMARLRHPNILAIHGADEEDGRSGIWCDLLDGETLQDVIDRIGPLDLSRVLALARPLVDALAVIHARGVTHGDIKPSNVMIQSDGEPILMDFGAGGGLGDGAPIAGSPLVMAPELFGGAALSPACDVYSFGALLYLLFTGRYPVEADNIDDLLNAHGGTDFTAIPAPFRSLVAECLSAQPESRPAAAVLATRLLAIEQAPARRRRVITVSAIIASLTLGLFFSSLGFWRASESAAQARAEKASAESTLGFLENMLQAPSTLNRGPELKVVDLLDSAARELDRTAEQATLRDARLRFILGRTYRTLEQYPPARASLNAALDIYQRELSHPDSEDLEAMVDLATIEINAGNLEEAGALLDEVVRRASERHGPRSHHALLAQFKKGEMANLVGDTQGSIELIESAYRQSEDLPEDDFLRSQMQAKLAQAYTYSGRLTEAEELVRRSLDWEYRYRGGETLDALVKLNSLSIILSNAGDPAGAEEAIRGALGVLDNIAPGTSRPRAGLRGNLAGAIAMQGRPEEALPMNQETLEMHRELGNTVGIITMTGNISLNYLDMGRPVEAIKWGEQAVEMARKEMGPEGQWTLLHETNLVECYLDGGLLERALADAEAQYQKNLRVLGERNMTTLIAGDNLAAARIRSGDYQSGLDLLENILAAKSETLGEDNPETWDTRELLAEGLIAKGQIPQARQLLDSLLAQRTATLPAEHSKVIRALALRERIELE